MKYTLVAIALALTVSGCQQAPVEVSTLPASNQLLISPNGNTIQPFCLDGTKWYNVNGTTIVQAHSLSGAPIACT